MIYGLLYTDRAKRDLNAATDAIAEKAPETAERWFEGFVGISKCSDETPPPLLLHRKATTVPLKFANLSTARKVVEQVVLCTRFVGQRRSFFQFAVLVKIY